MGIGARSADARRVTVRTVADAAGVSTATVSRVMSGITTVQPELAERVRRIADELGYRPSEAARGLVRGAMRHIGALMPDLGNAYFQDVVKGVHHDAAGAGFRMLIADHSGHPEDEHATALDLMGHVDGLALLSPRLDQPALRDLARRRTPIVLVNRVEPGIDLPMIGVDSFTATLELCGHLAQLGHRRVVYLSGNEAAWQDRERWRAVQTSRFMGIESTRVESDGTIETSYTVAEQALADSPTAVICFNDLAAIGVISRLRDLGVQVPADVSVTGFDDIAIGSHIFPSLTTVTSPRDELGRRAWALLHAALEGRSIEESTLMLPAPLVVRQSTAAARTSLG
jgi:LacI family transcriptional regulator